MSPLLAHKKNIVYINSLVLTCQPLQNEELPVCVHSAYKSHQSGVHSHTRSPALSHMQPAPSDFKPHTNHLSIFEAHSCNAFMVCVCMSARNVRLCSWRLTLVYAVGCDLGISVALTACATNLHIACVSPKSVLTRCERQAASGNIHPLTSATQRVKRVPAPPPPPLPLIHRYHPKSSQNAITIKLFK